MAHPPLAHRAHAPPRLRFPLLVIVAAVLISIILIVVLLLLPDLPATSSPPR